MTVDDMVDVKFEKVGKNVFRQVKKSPRVGKHRKLHTKG